jgi:hypothetical protein
VGSDQEAGDRARRRDMTTARQADLFGRPKRKRVRMAHVVDAGNGCESMVVQFGCKVCDWRSDWMKMRTVTEGRRGVPCPKCNEVNNG